MPSYLVRWEIDIDAEIPREAAEEALKVQRDFCSEATCFEVMSYKHRIVTVIDLLTDPSTDYEI